MIESQSRAGHPKRYVPIIWGTIFLITALYVFYKSSGILGYSLSGIFFFIAFSSLKTGLFDNDEKIREMTECTNKIFPLNDVENWPKIIEDISFKLSITREKFYSFWLHDLERLKVINKDEQMNKDVDLLLKTFQLFCVMGCLAEHGYVSDELGSGFTGELYIKLLGEDEKGLRLVRTFEEMISSNLNKDEKFGNLFWFFSGLFLESLKCNQLNADAIIAVARRVSSFMKFTLMSVAESFGDRETVGKLKDSLMHSKD